MSEDAGIALEAVADIVRARAGLALSSSRRDDLEAGVRRAMAKADVHDVARYRRLLEAGAVAFDDLVAELTIGETYFLREPSHFDFIRREVVPDVIRRLGPGHALRAWSAGCASGEEAYSLAIALDEAGAGETAQVLASDISRPALARARNATYGPWSLRGVDQAVVSRYFRPSGSLRALDDRIRRRVSFAYVNLAADAYPSLASGLWAMDLILCRNVLIYFDREATRRVAERLFATLAPGGWLIAGPSDPPLAPDAPFETVVTDRGVFYRRGDGTQAHVFSFPAPRDQAPRPPSLGDGEDEGGSRGDPQVAPTTVTVSPCPEAPRDESLARAQQALAAGDYDLAMELAGDTGDPAAAALSVRACANRDGAARAAELCAGAARRHPLSAEVHFLHAILLLDLGRDDDAIQAIRRTLYLDRALAMAHVVLGTLLGRRGDLAGARRAHRMAAELTSARPPGEPVPLGDGERAGSLAITAAAQAAMLERRSP